VGLRTPEDEGRLCTRKSLISWMSLSSMAAASPIITQRGLNLGGLLTNRAPQTLDIGLGKGRGVAGVEGHFVDPGEACRLL